MNNFWTNNNIFDKYVYACGSKFAAIMYVSKVARYRMTKYGNCIPESKALAWVITGVEPEEVSLWRDGRFNKIDKGLAYANDRILYIDDPVIQDAVRRSVNLSRSEGHLIYRYKGLTNNSQRSRVRVLCNMIWDEIRNIDVEDQL